MFLNPSEKELKFSYDLASSLMLYIGDKNID
jgi:hypothetical protein